MARLCIPSTEHRLPSTATEHRHFYYTLDDRTRSVSQGDRTPASSAGERAADEALGLAFLQLGQARQATRCALRPCTATLGNLMKQVTHTTRLAIPFTLCKAKGVKKT